jgi:hypothetical protein
VLRLPVSGGKTAADTGAVQPKGAARTASLNEIENRSRNLLMPFVSGRQCFPHDFKGAINEKDRRA